MYTPPSRKFASASAALAAAFVMTFTAVGPAQETTVSRPALHSYALISAPPVKCFERSAIDCTPIRA